MQQQFVRRAHDRGAHDRADEEPRGVERAAEHRVADHAEEDDAQRAAEDDPEEEIAEPRAAGRTPAADVSLIEVAVAAGAGGHRAEKDSKRPAGCGQKPQPTESLPESMT
jgi:hypothetical protein